MFIYINTKEAMDIAFMIMMTGTFLAWLIICGYWLKQHLKVEIEIEVQAQVLRDLLHTPAEQRSTRVLDLCFFAVANSLISKKHGTNEPLVKSEDFNTFELRLHLAERIKESEAEVYSKVGIGARSFVALTRKEKKQFVGAMKKLIEGWTMEIESDEECHLQGVHCSTGFEKEIKYIKKWIEEQSKEKVEEV